MAKEVFYFSHDYHARSDPKLADLFYHRGLAAIGAYWCIVEMLYEEGGFLLLSQCERIKHDLRARDGLINDLANGEYGLFKNDGVKFWSDSVNKRLRTREMKSESARHSAYLRWTNDANAMRTQCERNAIKESKVNKSKVNIPPIVPQGTLRSKNTEIKQTGAVVAGNQVTSGENPPSRTKFVLPDWIKPETWGAFKEMRQKSRAPLTGSAAKLLLHKLDRFRADGDDPNLVLEQSIMSGYRGVFALKQGQASPAKKGGNFGRSNGDQKPDTETPEQHMQRLKDSINKPF